MNLQALREGQRRAIQVLTRRVIKGESYTALVLPTRYGKSDGMRVAAVTLWQDGHIGCALALSPNVVLRDQLGNLKRWKVAFQRYELAPIDAAIKTLKSTRDLHDPNANGELFLSATIQLVQENIGTVEDWVRSVYHRTGKRILVYVDECHTGSDTNDWGQVTTRLAAAGAHVALWTATAIRSDGRRIPGFNFETAEEQTVRVYRRLEGSSPEKVRVELHEGTRTLLRLVPDHETSFREAWDDNVICKVGRVPFDVDLSRIGMGKVESGIHLSQMLTAGDVRKALSRAVRADVVIREGVSRLVRELLRFREVVRDTGGIIFCGNDGDGEDRSVNKHARQIRDAVLLAWPDCRVVIATSAEGGKAELQAFDDGIGDILIVKQMASLGLDIPRLKVGLDLSPVRTLAAYIQRMMRIASLYMNIQHCVWISPDDLLGRIAFDAFVTEGGGQASQSDLTLRRWWEEDRKGPEERDTFGVDGVGSADFEDSAENRAAKDRLAGVESILNAFPALTTLYSHAEIATRAGLFNIAPSETGVDGVNIRDTGVEAEVLRADINEVADDLVKRRMAYAGYSRDEFVSIRKDVFTDAYRAAGVSYGQRLGDVKEVPTLQRVRAALVRLGGDIAETHDA